MGLRCKRCGGEEHVKNGLMRGHQRYLCKSCGFNFTDTPPRGKPLALKAAAVLLYVSGLSVDSSGRRNTAYVSCSEELVQSLGRGSPAQGLSRPAVEGERHGCKVLGAGDAEVGALWKVLAQQPVGVLVRAALPGAVGIAEVDRHASL